MHPAIWYNDRRPAIEYADAIAGSPARQRIVTGHHGLAVLLHDEWHYGTATRRRT